MKKSESWFFIRILAAITAVTFIVCTVLHGVMTGADITGTCTVASLAALIYADWRARLEAAQEDWNDYIAEKHDAQVEQENIRQAQDNLFQAYADGSIYGGR